MTHKIVCISLNPALDLTGTLPHIDLGNVNRVQASELHAAGKGLNVARVLSDLGAEVTITGFIGIENQQVFKQAFSSLRLTDECIRVSGATRINVKLVTQDNNVTDINFPSFEVNKTALSNFEKKLMELAEDHDYFVLTGSLPKGITPEKCAQWINDLYRIGKKVIFDSSERALTVGVKSQPYLIKPNIDELSQLLNEKITTLSELQAVLPLLDQYNIPNIVISLGAEGVVWYREEETLYAKPPSMPIVSTVGAGDTLVAGLCWGILQNLDSKQTLIMATVLSALSVSQIGTGIVDKSKWHALQEQIKFLVI